MEFKPRYPQPFTLTEATAMDVSVITEEISRLHNSLQHLKQTQKTLHEYTAESPENVDPEFAKALDENEIVIGSQEERIVILKLALSEKGIHAGDHYDFKTVTLAESNTRTSENQTSAGGVSLGDSRNDNNTGIHL